MLDVAGQSEPEATGQGMDVDVDDTQPQTPIICSPYDDSAPHSPEHSINQGSRLSTNKHNLKLNLSAPPTRLDVGVSPPITRALEIP